MITSIIAGLVAAAPTDTPTTLRAVCKNIQGRVLGYDKGKLVDDADGYKNSVFVYTIKGTTAEIITQSSEISGGKRAVDEGTPIFINNHMIAIPVLYEAALFSHVLYPLAGKVLISRATDGFGAVDDSVVGYMMIGDCEFRTTD